MCNLQAGMQPALLQRSVCRSSTVLQPRSVATAVHCCSLALYRCKATFACFERLRTSKSGSSCVYLEGTTSRHFCLLKRGQDEIRHGGVELHEDGVVIRGSWLLSRIPCQFRTLALK